MCAHHEVSYTPIQTKQVALIDWRLALGLWPFILTPGAFWGKTIACGAVCDGRCG